MFRRNLLPVWIGISFLSCMFLMGQEAWKPFCTQDKDCASGDQFCGKIIGACDGLGMCVDKPDACIEIYDPVCGCDGVTYDNFCFAAYEGVNVDYGGQCVTEPRLEAYSNSGCLSQGKVETPGDQYPWCGGDEVEIRVEGQTIHLNHMNATYNCCPDDIAVTLEVEGNVLKLTEREILTTPCHCLCCYNVKSTIVDLSPGSYVIEYCWYDYEEWETVCHTEEGEIV